MPAARRPRRQSRGSLARWPFPSSPPSPEAWSRCSPASCAAWARSTSSRPAPACRSKAPSRRPTASACGRASPAPWPAADGDELYATTYRVDWDAHLGVDGTLAVDFSGVSDTIRDTRYGAVRMKDAVVDQFRARHGDRRPSVDTRAPDLRINGHLVRGRVTVSLDLSGDSLHRRGYRTDRVQVEAPLKENLAAAVLLFAAWP